jgi:hypothetical protein
MVASKMSLRTSNSLAFAGMQPELHPACAIPQWPPSNMHAASASVAVVAVPKICLYAPRFASEAAAGPLEVWHWLFGVTI